MASFNKNCTVYINKDDSVNWFVSRTYTFISFQHTDTTYFLLLFYLAKEKLLHIVTNPLYWKHMLYGRKKYIREILCSILASFLSHYFKYFLVFPFSYHAHSDKIIIVTFSNIYIKLHWGTCMFIWIKIYFWFCWVSTKWLIVDREEIYFFSTLQRNSWHDIYTRRELCNSV